MADDQSDKTPDATIDLGDEEKRERRRKAINGELDVDDIQDDELRRKIKKARGELDDDEDDDVSGKVRMSGSSENAEDDVDVSNTGGASQRIAPGGGDDESFEVSDDLEESAQEAHDVMADVSESQAEAAMGEVELNVREDIDPEHFDYEAQDFSHFGGFDDEAPIEYNGTVFLFEMPPNRKQEQLINEMQMAGKSTVDMMEKVIDAVITRPENIGDITAEWTPFEKIGLGVLVLEYLGVSALGNM